MVIPLLYCSLEILLPWAVVLIFEWIFEQKFRQDKLSLVVILGQNILFEHIFKCKENDFINLVSNSDFFTTKTCPKFSHILLKQETGGDTWKISHFVAVRVWICAPIDAVRPFFSLDQCPVTSSLLSRTLGGLCKLVKPLARAFVIRP